jgi:hypothetical protein
VTEALVGLVGGAVLTAAFWFVTAHVVVPRIEFGEHIVRREVASGELRFRLLISNRGRRRAVDLRYRALLQIPGVESMSGLTGSAGFRLRLLKSDDFVMPAGRSFVLSMSLPPAEKLLEIATIRALYPRGLPSNGLTIEDVLKRSEGAYIVMQVLCSDEFSGSRKLFLSPRYDRGKIIHRALGEFADSTA